MRLTKQDLFPPKQKLQGAWSVNNRNKIQSKMLLNNLHMDLLQREYPFLGKELLNDIYKNNSSNLENTLSTLYQITGHEASFQNNTISSSNITEEDLPCLPTNSKELLIQIEKEANNFEDEYATIDQLQQELKECNRKITNYCTGKKFLAIQVESDKVSAGKCKNRQEK